MESNNWSNLKKDLYRRLQKPTSHPTTIFYFLISVVILGNIGCILEIISYIKSNGVESFEAIARSLISYFPAIAMPACLQIFISESAIKSLKTFIFAAMVLMIIAALYLYISITANNSLSTLIYAGIATIFSYLSWFIANADNEDLQDSDPDDPTGGSDPSRTINGSLSGMKS